MLQHCDGPQRDHACRGFVTGLQQNHAVHDRRLATELARRDVIGHQPAHQVVTRFALLERRQLPHVVEHGADRRGLLLVGRSRVEALGAVLLEELVILVGDAEQQGDHQRGHRQRESANKIGGRSSRDHVVQESVDQLLNLRTHRLGTPKGEVPGHHPPQSVVLGIVDSRERSPACCRRRPSLSSCPGIVFARQARIDQSGPDVLVAADHPRRL